MRNIDRNIRARLGSWPHEPDVAHLVLLDHHMVPEHRHLEAWTDMARARGVRALRTGALFPDSVPAFIDAGFRPIDQLALLELVLIDAASIDLCAIESGPVRSRPLRQRHFGAAAAVDRRAFAAPWGYDRAALVDVRRATPRHRARGVFVDRAVIAFAISGIAGSTGYLQRLAVDPSGQRRGFGRVLVVDAIGWMRRRDVERVFVNTGVDNHVAIGLYESLGFRRSSHGLVILELPLSDS